MNTPRTADSGSLPDLATLQRQCGWPLADGDALRQGRLGEPDARLVPFVDALTRRCVVLRPPEGGLLVVMADPRDDGTRLWLRRRLGAQPAGTVRWRLADADALLHLLQQRERGTDGGALGSAAAGAAGLDAPLDLSHGGLQAADDPVVRLLNATLYDALEARASDLHLESDAEGLAIRFRLDGVLTPVGRIAGTAAAQQAISRIKVLAALDIAEQRLPQDGRLKVRVGGRPVDLRVSIMPSIHGEDAVLRVLDRQQLTGPQGTLTVEHLGLDPRDAEVARRLAGLPYGLFLVTGPTGSGKTTTLYALLNGLRHGQDKTVTIEDPVEYELPGVLQIPVNEAKGLTFARGLRSVLRHDPDRIMVGEIRDTETAQIALQAALTGHQVHATVHANSAVDVIGRLSTMGIDPYNLATALNGVLAQRLVRLLCNACGGEGCSHCRGTGYRGRRAVVETLVIDDALRALIASRATPGALRDAMQQQGARSLRAAAESLVDAGLTSRQEIDRVTLAAR
ncbi:GspE/PulE family protein [Pseudaquabacterium pictum]|uniref:Type II secretion system ATPase PulE n=1 Tax=Pseudaquabacterium pictum TaxID=2315236 RepID=A0A480B2Z9_9BURK|nr:GspE/PulE family protein [Rubrivivax pictus]GCL66275.1 type II secretion system ATPase PulE [Rubrivivax pictus]